MAISDRNRKILWALSGNACARCQAGLVQAPEAEGDIHAMVGQECHIVGRSFAGPRGEEDPNGTHDDLANLILLCANCHAIIDDQPQRWTSDALRRLKHDHEQRVAQPQASWTSGIKLQGRERPLRLGLVTSGDALLSTLGGAFSHINSTPDRMSTPQREVVGDFLQSLQDWSEAIHDIGPKRRMEAG